MTNTAIVTATPPQCTTTWTTRRNHAAGREHKCTLPQGHYGRICLCDCGATHHRNRRPLLTKETPCPPSETDAR
jgi:hypothetical protein